MKKEIWKDIKLYKGTYQISSKGRVKSLRNGTERILKSTPNEKGYLRVCLTDENHIPRQHKIHRLVAEAFIPNPKNKKEVNHKNFNRQDNRVENLEWVTHYENLRYSCVNFRYSKGITRHPKRVRITFYDGTTRVFDNLKLASKELGIELHALRYLVNSNATINNDYFNPPLSFESI